VKLKNQNLSIMNKEEREIKEFLWKNYQDAVIVVDNIELISKLMQSYTDKKVKEALEEVENVIPSKKEVLEVSGTSRHFIMGVNWMSGKMIDVINKFKNVSIYSPVQTFRCGICGSVYDVFDGVPPAMCTAKTSSPGTICAGELIKITV
jgi:hypothetical protein